MEADDFLGLGWERGRASPRFEPDAAGEAIETASGPGKLYLYSRQETADKEHTVRG